MSSPNYTSPPLPRLTGRLLFVHKGGIVAAADRSPVGACLCRGDGRVEVATEMLAPARKVLSLFRGLRGADHIGEAHTDADYKAPERRAVGGPRAPRGSHRFTALGQFPVEAWRPAAPARLAFRHDTRSRKRSWTSPGAAGCGRGAGAGGGRYRDEEV